jgi:hypothetical protein
MRAPESAETGSGGVVKIDAHKAKTLKRATGREIPSMVSHFHQVLRGQRGAGDLRLTHGIVSKGR